MNIQQKVAEFIEKHELEGKAEFRILDLVAEVGEIAADAAKSSDYGMDKARMEVKKDEIGDALFSLLTVAESFDIDAEEALEEAMEKYEDRIDNKGDPSSK